MSLLLILVIGFLVYLVENIIYKKNWVKGLSVDCDFGKYVLRVGDSNTLVETIKNDKSLPLPVLQIKFAITRTFKFKKDNNSNVSDFYYRNEFFSVPAKEKLTRIYRFTPTHRGVYTIHSLDIICKDIFMTSSMYAQKKCYQTVTVLPQKLSDKEIPSEIVMLSGDTVSRLKYIEDPFEFASIREYLPTDPLNHINWKSTARMNDGLFVNTFNSTIQKNVNIILNIEVNQVLKSEDIIEYAIRICAYFTEYFIRKNISVSLFTNAYDIDSKELVNVASGCSIGHINTIEIALAHIDVSLGFKDFLSMFNEYFAGASLSDEYILVSNYHKDDLADSFNMVCKNGFNIRWIVPEFARTQVNKNTLYADREVKWVIDDEI